MIYTFERVLIRGEKTVKCSSGCGRRLKRSNTFEQTLNPWNTRKDGVPKQRTDIYPELQAERDQWIKEPEICDHCFKEQEHAEDSRTLHRLCKKTDLYFPK